MQTSKWINLNLSCRLSSERIHYILFFISVCFSKPRKVETVVESETLRENILIKRKLKPRLRNRNKKLRKKTLLDVKSLECIEGDKAPIQRLNRNKTKAKLSGQTLRDEPLAKTEKTESLNTELGANIEDSEDQQFYKDSFINSPKVRFRFVYIDLLVLKERYIHKGNEYYYHYPSPGNE